MIKDRYQKTELVEWRKLTPFQPTAIKKTSKARLDKLKRSLINNGFAPPLYIWQDKNVMYSLDGHHRLKVLQELSDNRFEDKLIKTPNKVRCVFLKCRNLLDAKKVFLTFQAHTDIKKNSKKHKWIIANNDKAAT